MENETGLIIGRIRTICDQIAFGVTITTQELAIRCYPKTAEGWSESRKALYAAIASAKTREALAAYWTRGPEEPSRFGSKRPYLWHLPLPVCSLCAGTGFASPLHTEW